MPQNFTYRGVRIEQHRRRWRWRVQESGKRTIRSAASREEACAAVDAFLDHRDSQSALEAAAIRTPLTVGQLTDAWLLARQPEFAPATAKQYGIHIRVHIKRGIGDADAHQIKPRELTDFYKSLRWKSAKESHNILRQAFAWGIANEIVLRASNPCAFARPSRRTSTDHDGSYDSDDRIRPVDEKDIPTKTEVEKLLVDAESNGDRTWWLFLMIASALGARPGEICALRRRDIDLKKSTIRIEWGADKVGGVVKRPKTKWSVRSLPVSRKRLAEIADDLPSDPDAFLFPSNTYRGAKSKLPCWNTRTVKRHLDKAIARTGIKHITGHSFRHFVATQLLARGMSPTQVARYLGHADDQLVRKLYGNHIVDDEQRKIGEIASRLLEDDGAP